MKPDKVSVTCPHCGQVQLEPRDGYSTVCRKCRQHFRIEDALRPKAAAEQKHHDTQQVTCFQCGTMLAVAAGAESTMCKRCSAHIDLRDYTINQAVSKNFRTHGSFTIGEKGYVFNTEAEVGDAVIKGKFLGKLNAHRTFTLYAPTEFKGSFKAGLFILPAGIKFLWAKPLEVHSVDIAGELVANVHVPGTVLLRATAHLFGDIEAANLIMEPGAVLVGQVKIGSRPAPPALAQEAVPVLPATVVVAPVPEAAEVKPAELPGLLEQAPPSAKRKSPARPKNRA